MKATKTLNAALAASLLAGATLANAASYDVTGSLDSFSSNPAVISAVFNPLNPTFSGTWDVDTSSLSGNAGFGAYSIDWSLTGLGYAGTTTYNSVGYQLTSTGTTYDAATRKLTVNGTLATTSRDYSCTGAAFFCGSVMPTYDLALTLTFTDDSLKAFTGSLTASDDDGNGSSYNYAWSFNGAAPAVPVPAAAWLFGSGLAGLAGLARNRRR